MFPPDGLVVGTQSTTTGAGVPQFLTVTVKLHWPWLPKESVALQVTVVVPAGKDEPEAGEQAVVATAQLSAAWGEKFTTAPHWPGSLHCVMLAGHWIVGGSASWTVTRKEQVTVRPEVVVAVQVTLDDPIWKNEPERGLQVTGPGTQSPELVGE